MCEICDGISDEYELDSDEESYREYQRSMRYKLDVYVHEIDPWLIPIERLCIIGITLHYLFT